MMSGLGRSLVKSHKRKQRFVAKDGHKHSTDLPDGRDWGRLNLHSVTEQTSLDDFLDKVQLADKEYNSEFFNIKIVSQDTANGILSESEKLSVSTAQEKHKNLLRIPRRPQWNQNTSKEELDRNENESFLEWRRNLSLLNEEEHINLTPYEKNLEVWRQLWRVIERSDVVVQIIDSRNPLLFRCEDLEIYVKETDGKKLNVLLLNKADFLTLNQREMWAHYFSSIGVKVAFFSALQQMQKDEEASEESESDEISDSELETVTKAQDFVTKESLIEKEKLSCNVEQSSNQSNTSVHNDPKLLSREELITFLKNLGQEVQKNSVARVGLVGYPNVGKSSTINAVLSSKKVSVSATPGKTKHFQTIMVDSELCFCDCPGLVFPNFVSTKAVMVINGILPIDQLTSHIPPVTLVSNVIPREVLESTYSIKLPTPSEGQDPTRPPTAEEFLGAHGYMRGFMTQRGLPDTARSARYVLKDFVNGKLLYCHAPPDVKQEEYQEFSLKNLAKTNTSVQSVFHGAESINAGKDFDQTFFKMLHERNKKSKEAESLSGFPGAHVKNLDHANRMMNGQRVSSNAKNTKKEYKLHHNKNRKEKLRKVHAYLDQ